MPENKFAVGALGDDVVILRDVPHRLSKEEALNLAAYLVAIATLDSEKEFLPILSEVENT